MFQINDCARPEKWPVAPHVKHLQSSIIREILKFSSQPGVISFAGGLPAPELFPLDLLKQLTVSVLDTYGAASVQYSLTRGILPLREYLAAKDSAAGAESNADNIIITSGSQQGIELLARVFIDPGDYVLVENPTYLGALQVFNYYRARYATVEMDNEGMLLDQLEEKIRRFNPKLIYTVSNFHNPTGITMSARRRIRLVEIARKWDIPIIDDNPYGDIRFAGEPLPSLKSHGGDQVIMLETFSKTVAPGLRIAWINGVKSVIDYIEKVKQCADLHTNTFNQYVIYEFCKRGHLESHIEKIKTDYLAKRGVMLKAMHETFPDGVTWTEPEGGLFLWVRLPEHMSAKELLPKAIDMKVAYVYGQPFYPNGEGENTMRLNFSTASHDQIREGITRLAGLLKDNM